MKAFIFTGMMTLAAIAHAATETPHAYCGTLKDWGDSYQIIDGSYDVYFAQDDSAPADLKGVGKYLGSLRGAAANKCYCITGTAQSFNRGGQTAYMFLQVTGLKSCQTIIE